MEARQRAMLAISASLDPANVLSAVARHACTLTGSRVAAIYLLDSDTRTLQLIAGHRLPQDSLGTQLTPAEGFVGRAFKRKHVLVADKKASLEAFHLPPGHTAAVSLSTGAKRWGVLQVMRSKRARPLDRADLAALEWFAIPAAQAIANTREYYHSVQTIGQFQVANERLRAAGNITRALANVGYDLDRMLAQALDGVCRSLRLPGGAIQLLDEQTAQLVTVVERNLPNAARERAVLSNSLTVEPLDRSDDHDALISVPLVARDHTIGVMQLVIQVERVLSSDDRDALSIVANQLALGIENARLFVRIGAEEQRLRAILASTDNVILSVDVEGQLLTANEAAERAFGFKLQDYSGLPLSRATTNVALNSALEQARVQRDVRRRTFQVPLSDEHTLSASMSPIPAVDGAVQGWVFVMQDVTSFREMEELRTDMILTASHELRNPINLARGALELLEQCLPNPDEVQREALDLALLGVGRAGSLITDLLDLERIERRVGLRLEPCDCARFLRTIEQEFRLQAQNRGAFFEVHACDSTLAVWGDERLLRRVVSNLVDNALKYTPPGGQVRVEARAEAGQVLFDVCDNGPGIPLEAQPYVFERFYRLPSQPDDVKGTGLGLTIVKSIVEQHGGRVWVTSQPGHGSTFTVSLPAYQETKL
jgi:PAS domain S-box-containing protein